jgi:hypothetical protein
VKLFLCFFLTERHAMKAYWESGGIAPRILDLGTRRIWVVSFTSRPLNPQEKSPCHPLDRTLGGYQSRSDSSGEEKNSQLLPGLEPPIIQPVAQRYTTELSQLQCELNCCLIPLQVSVYFLCFCQMKTESQWLTRNWQIMQPQNPTRANPPVLPPEAQTH